MADRSPSGGPSGHRARASTGSVIFQGDDLLDCWLDGAAGDRVLGGNSPRRAGGRTARKKLAARLRRTAGQAGPQVPVAALGRHEQRIQIARALVCHSPILLMDEPFAAVDAQTRGMLQDELTTI